MSTIPMYLGVPVLSPLLQDFDVFVLTDLPLLIVRAKGNI
jgi:hypothetical protein